MAITRLWQTGFETGNVDEWDYRNNNPFVQSSIKRTGTYAYADGDVQRWSQKYFSATYQMRGGYFFYGNPAISTNRMQIETAGAANAVHMVASTNNDLIFYCNGISRGTAVGKNGTFWSHISFDFKIDPSSGWFYIWIDGIPLIEFSGNTGSTAVTKFGLGHWAGNGNYNCYYDDVYIDDSTGESVPNTPPILTFPYVIPNGNGNYSQWTGSDLDQTNNYLLVDERPAGTTDYVTASGVDLYDSYTMSNYTLGANEAVKAVIPVSYNKRDSSTEKLAMGTRYSSTDTVVSGVDLSVGSYGFIYGRQTTKPGGGSWDQTSIDGFEVVIKSDGTF